MSNPPRTRKRVEAEPRTLKRGIDGSGFTQCKECVKDIPVGVSDMHDCALDKKIMSHLECHYAIDADERKRKGTKGKSPDSMEPQNGPNKAKKSKDPRRPKKPKTAFLIFQEEFRMQHKENPDYNSRAEVFKQGRQKWKSMTIEEKEPYNLKAAEQKEEYLVAMYAYTEEFMQAYEEADSAEVGKIDLEAQAGGSEEALETDEE